MVGTYFADAAQRQHHDEGRHGEADDDGREDQCLRQRITVLDTFADDGRNPGSQAPHGKDEQVDGVGNQRQPHDHWKYPGAQEQVDTACRHDSERDREYRFHHTTSLLESSCLTWPILERISNVAPTTTR